MADVVLKTGDLIKVTIAPPAIVPLLQAPVPLVGSSTVVKISGCSICLLGDEIPVELREPLPYTAPPFTNPGTGRLSLSLLPGNQTMLTKNGKAILIRGSVFIALLTVQTPATQTTTAGPVPDPVATKPGTAEFIPAEETVLAGLSQLE
jgi:Contractile injection system spike tip protein